MCWTLRHMCSSATRRSSCMGWSGSAYHNGIAGHGCDAARYEWRTFACAAVAAAMPHRVGVRARVRACVLMCACAYVDVCREGAVERGSDVMRMQRSLELAPLGLQVANFAFARLCDRSLSQCCAHSPQCWRATGSNGNAAQRIRTRVAAAAAASSAATSASRQARASCMTPKSIGRTGHRRRRLNRRASSAACTAAARSCAAASSTLSVAISALHTEALRPRALSLRTLVVRGCYRVLRMVL